jgi:PHD/YefM family antitoxin component YafN of YafNO toxin-antitoxin module
MAMVSTRNSLSSLREIDIDETYVFWYDLAMGTPKISKPSELREDLYNTLEQVCQGERFIISAKSGDVVLISKKEFDCLIDDLDILKEFEEPVDHSQLIENEQVFDRLNQKFGFSDANSLDKKSRKKSK